MLLVAPKDGGTAFRCDHGINRVLEHVDAITHADGQRATGTAFAGNRDNDRYPDLRHFAQVERNRLGLAALFRVDSGVRARRIDEGQDWPFELFRDFHDAKRLAVTLGLWHSEIAVELLFGVS